MRIDKVYNIKLMIIILNKTCNNLLCLLYVIFQKIHFNHYNINFTNFYKDLEFFKIFLLKDQLKKIDEL